MIYIFLDERVENLPQAKRFIIASFSVLPDNWKGLHRQMVQQIVSVGPNRRLEKIQELLDQTKGLAILTYSDIPDRLLPKGEIDGTDDIPRMSRTDHIWGNAVALHLAYAFACLCRAAAHFLEQVEIYHDPKTLTVPHRTALHKLVSDRLTRFPEESGFKNLFQVSKIDGISKAHSLQSADHLQLGISVTDHLGHQAKNLISRSLPQNRIKIINHSCDILDSIKKFCPDLQIGSTLTAPAEQT